MSRTFTPGTKYGPAIKEHVTFLIKERFKQYFGRIRLAGTDIKRRKAALVRQIADSVERPMGFTMASWCALIKLQLEALIHKRELMFNGMVAMMREFLKRRAQNRRGKKARRQDGSYNNWSRQPRLA